jgi:hypothetical protein
MKMLFDNCKSKRTTMASEELIEEYIKVETDTDITISALVIHWEGTHLPVSHWELVHVLPLGASQIAINKCIAEVLEDDRYFKTCQKCGEINALGHIGYDENLEVDDDEDNDEDDDELENDENKQPEKRYPESVICMGCMEAFYNVVY